METPGLFDFVCCNRMIWGASEYREFKLRHTSGAPDRFIEQAAPALERYAQASSASITDAVRDAQAHRLQDKVPEFLAARFGRNISQMIAATHIAEEGRPIETRWDAVVGATAYARSIPFQNERVEFETIAGGLLL